VSGPKNTPSAIDKWISGGLRYVELPSGTSMRVRIPSTERMLRAGTMPEGLREMALKFATTGIALDELDAAAAENFLRMKDHLVADSIREIYEGDDPDPEHATEGWTPVKISATDLEEFEIDPDDLSALSAITLRQTTVNSVTAATRRDRGRITNAEAETIVADERGDTLPAWENFREPAVRTDRARPAGEGVGDAAEPDRRDLGAARSARLRRGDLPSSGVRGRADS
jgi:hypothetical protein